MPTSQEIPEGRRWIAYAGLLAALAVATVLMMFAIGR